MTQPGDNEADIQLVRAGDEVTLLIDGGQAMQAWERELMWESADILCSYGSEFLEVGLGLGLSALRVASNPRTRKHRVIEKYQRVIDLFYQEHPSPPPTLEVIHADFFDHVRMLEPDCVDGIFFDPYFPLDSQILADVELWSEVVPAMVRALRTGGVLIPFFSMRPLLRWQFVPYFDRVIVERRRYHAYPTSDYTSAPSGDAFIQCFVKTG